MFGGTFNPIHNGHIRLINKVDEIYHFDRIIVMPTNIPPHKVCKDLASENDRYNMCKLAFNRYDKVYVSDYEINNTQKSFSYLTIEHLRRTYLYSEIYLIIGSDMFLSFETWKNFKYILKNATIITAARNKDEYNKLLEYKNILLEFEAKIEVLNIEPYIVSSTKVRQAINNHIDCSCYLPCEVVKYIGEKKLYI